VQRSRHAGWPSAHVAVDDHLRLADVELPPSERAHDAVAFLERAFGWYRNQGIQIEAMMTDNGSAYRSGAWRECCALLRLRHLRTRPYAP
jgi:transposase InsO family protein